MGRFSERKQAPHVILRCRCGAEATIVDPGGKFVNEDGSPDENGDVYRVQRWARQWVDRHEKHCGEGAVTREDG